MAASLPVFMDLNETQKKFAKKAERIAETKRFAGILRAHLPSKEPIAMEESISVFLDLCETEKKFAKKAARAASISAAKKAERIAETKRFAGILRAHLPPKESVKVKEKLE
jgi:hypothetical protein